MLSINLKPDDKTLAGFSEAWLFFLGATAAPLLAYRGRPGWALAAWAAAVVVRAIGLWRPRLVKPLYLAMTLAAAPIGWAVSHIALAVFYYLVVTPIGLALRLTGRDALGLRFDKGGSSYFTPYEPGKDPRSYLRRF